MAYAALAVVEDYFDRASVISTFILYQRWQPRQYFATNFDPEINFREFTGTVLVLQTAQWVQQNACSEVQTDRRNLPVGGRTDQLHGLGP